MSSTMGYRDLISMAEANSLTKQREIERKLREGAGKDKVVDPKQAKLKVGVQKFLAKKEEEERRLKEASLKKKRMLLELRSQDRKANSRVNRMLKMTKSANKSCIDDAQECLSEACTAQASETQPDEDDYGYTSTYAAEMHKKMLERYKAVPKAPPPSKKAYVEPPTPRKFDAVSKPSSKRHEAPSQNVCPKPALQLPKQRIPKKTDVNPPAFVDLLRLAEQKCKEPIVIKKPSKDMFNGPEFKYGRPMTAKEKEEHKSEMALKQRVRNNLAAGGGTYPTKDTSKQSHISSTNKLAVPNDSKGRNIEMGKPRKLESKLETALTKGADNNQSRNIPHKSDKRNLPVSASSRAEQNSYSKASPPYVSSTSSFRPSPAAALRKMEPPQAKIAKLDMPSGKPSREMKTSSNHQPKLSGIPHRNGPEQRPTYSDDAPRNRQPNRPPQKMDSRPKPAPLRTSSSVPQNSRSMPSNKPESSNRYDFPTHKKDKPSFKGRAVILSDDEYDSEMDDFIDDSDVPQEDISNVIGQIFGYNKKKYADEDSGDECMESSVTQQWNEERRTLKIGMQEDLEEKRREEEEEKRRAMYLKMKRKQQRNQR